MPQSIVDTPSMSIRVAGGFSRDRSYRALTTVWISPFSRISSRTKKSPTSPCSKSRTASPRAATRRRSSPFATTSNELIRGLKSRKPQLVFNLVESFGDDIMGGVIGVAGVLDLLQIPYTGGGPGEIFLQEDKALTKKLLAFEGIPLPGLRDVSRRRQLRNRRQPAHAAVREAAAHGRVDRYRREARSCATRSR